MLSKWGKWATMVLIGSSVGLMTTTAQAKSSYRITKTQRINWTPYRLKNSKQIRFTWDKTHTNRMCILNQYGTGWLVDAKVTMTHGHHSATYLHIRDSNREVGYVYAKAMVKGYPKNYQTDTSLRSYYRFNAATRVGLSGGGTVTLPNGTIVQGTISANHGQALLNINEARLSYHLRQQIGLKDTQTFKKIVLAKTAATVIDQPSYSTEQHADDVNAVTDEELFAGDPAAKKFPQLLRTTSDGYVEYYDNGSDQRWNLYFPQGEPVSQKILRASKSHGRITIAYRDHLKGLRDTSTTVAGAAGYQLTIQNQRQIQTVDEDSYARYQVGNQPFFTYRGVTDPPITAKKMSPQALAKRVQAAPKMTYYRTTRTLRLKAPFNAYTFGTLPKTITLPKGTIVAGNLNYRYQKGKKITIMEVATNRLSTKRLTPGYRAGLWASLDTAEVKQYWSFARVARPAYMPKNNSTGDLYVGRSPQAILTRKLVKRSARITTDGYVEIRQNTPTDWYVEWDAQYGKPKTSVKIERTTIKGHTRYLYLAQKLSGFKTQKVHYHGKTQYRVALFNPQKAYAVQFNLDGDAEGLKPNAYGVLVFGGQAVYTSYNLK